MDNFVRKIILACSFIMLFSLNIVFSGPMVAYFFNDGSVFTFSGMIAYVLTLLVFVLKPDKIPTHGKVFTVNMVVIVLSVVGMFLLRGNFVGINVLFFVLGIFCTYNLVLLIEMLGRFSGDGKAMNNSAYVVGVCYVPYHLVHFMINSDLMAVGVAVVVAGILLGTYLPTTLEDRSVEKVKIKENGKLISIFCGIFFLVNVRGGISEGYYSAIYEGTSLSVMLMVMYVVFLAVIYRCGYRYSNFLYTVFFLVFSLGQSIFVFNGKNIAPLLLTSVAYLFFDVFTWGGAAHLSSFFEKPYRVIGAGLASGALGSTIGSLILRDFSPQVNAIICNLLIGVTLLFVQMFFYELKKAESLYEFYNRLNQDGKNVLTEREKEVLDLLVTGITNDEIAERLFIVKGTVKIHARNVYRKMGVSNKKELIGLYEGIVGE